VPPGSAAELRHRVVQLEDEVERLSGELKALRAEQKPASAK
jgi:uncharacterized small protein (DUF1192 family)